MKERIVSCDLDPTHPLIIDIEEISQATTPGAMELDNGNVTRAE